jgi:acylphosphatase
MDATVRTVQLRISGRVQGVGYRAWLVDTATRHGLRGWVRNRIDGSVEAMLHGPGAVCDAVIALAQRGPRAAHVTGVIASPCATAPADLPASFEPRPTA